MNIMVTKHDSIVLFIDHFMTAIDQSLATIVSKDIIKQILTDLAME